MEASFIYLLIPSQTLKVMVMLISSRIFLTKIDLINGSLFTLDILDHNRKLRLTSDGQIQRIIKNMKMLDISLFPNITSLQEEINISQDSTETLPWLHSILEKAHLNQEMISKLKTMLSMQQSDKSNCQENNQMTKLKRRRMKTMMMVLLLQVLPMIISLKLMKPKNPRKNQQNMVMDFGQDS